MNNVKAYAAPSAEMIWLIPDADIAANDYQFGSPWKPPGYFSSTNNNASGVAIYGVGEGWAEDGYTFKKDTTS